jgi:hypothetical protein
MIELGYYKHFKGNIYEVIGIGKHSETLEELVIYKSTKDNSIWVRPLSMWNETIERDNKTYKRFEYIGKNINLTNN